MMLTLITIELYKIFRKVRTYISFITIGILTGVIQLAMYLQGDKYLNFLTNSFQENFYFTGNFLNGYLISYLIMGTLTLQIPFLIALVAGDLLAGEATMGTYRLIISRPVSRIKLLLSKFIAGLIYTNALILFLALMSIGLGTLIFGTGELIVLRDYIIILKSDDILWRFIIAYGFAALSMSVIASLAFLFSSLVENAIGPIVATMAVMIVFLIFSNLDFSIFESIRPYLFTYYMTSWMDVFDQPANLTSVGESALILFAHLIVFFGLSLLIFRKKDILS